MFPSRRFLWVASAGLLPCLLAPIWDGGYPVALAWLVFCGCAAASERILGLRPEEVGVRRTLPRVFSLGETADVVLTLRNDTPRPAQVEVMDSPPGDWETEGLPLQARLAPRGDAELRYRVRPERRGQMEFREVTLRVTQGAGLLVHQISVPATERVRVYPDLRHVARYELLARRAHLGEMGIHRMRTSGQGSEFERLRDYTPDDEYRRIDWKATARRGRPISRVFEMERSQHVLIVVDAGRRMAARSGRHTRLDQAVNAALLLCHVVLKAGDRVGLLVVSDRVEAFLPPGKGQRHFHQCLELLYGVEARYCHVEYGAAMEQIVTRCRRRALVVVFSELVDEDASAELVQAVRLLRPLHLPLCVTMENEGITACADQAVTSVDSLFERAAALELLAERRTVVERLQRDGALVLESPPEQLSVQVVNRYLELKARQLL